MQNFLFDSVYLNWLIVAIIFFIIEVASFTLLFLWLGIAALLVSVIALIVPDISFTNQLFCFAITATLAVISWVLFFKSKQKRIGDKRMNNRAERYVGYSVALIEPVSNGYSKVKIEDSLWKVRCSAEADKGDMVTIIGTDGTVLIADKK